MIALEGELLHYVMLWYRSDRTSMNTQLIRCRLNDVRDKARALHLYQSQAAYRSSIKKIKPAEAPGTVG